MLVNNTLEKVKSKYNTKLEVTKSLGMGTYIQVGGLTQSGGIVNDIWKKTVRKLKKVISPQKVLILGLGGGSVAKQISKTYPKVKLTGVEIDPLMVKLGKKYLGLDDVKIKIVIKDAFAFCKKPGSFDLVVVDLYVGDRFPQRAESEDFILDIKKILNKNGVVIFNRLYYGEKRKEAQLFAEKLKKYFESVDRIFPQANMMIVCR